MKNQKIAYLFLLGLITGLPTREALSQLSMDLQLRPKFELRQGYKQLTSMESVPAALVSQRTRINLQYQQDKLKIKITPQDVRLWGDEHIAGLTGVIGDEASWDLHEAYAEVTILQGLDISVGRQELAYDNMSLLSTRNWNQNGIASDAVVLKAKRKGWQAHLAGTWNTFKESYSNNYFPSDRLKTIGLLWLHKTISNGTHFSLVHVSSGLTETDTTNNLQFRQTSGIYVGYQKKHFAIKGDLYYQYGRNQPGNRVSAWLADADLSQKFGILVAGAGLGYVSGNSAKTLKTTTDRHFYEIYRAKHRFFGSMDYFTNLPKQNKEGGLIDYFLYLDFKITSKIQIRNTTHYFTLAQTNDNTPDNKNLGIENDLVMNYKWSEWSSLEIGYMIFRPTSSLQQLHGVSDVKSNHFSYIMLTLTPTLLKQYTSEK